MNETAIEDLESLGRDAARQVMGADSVEKVEVEAAVDEYDSPIYNFTFVIDRDRVVHGPRLLRVRLIQKLRDTLIARGDEHYPVIELLDRTDWDRRHSA